MITSDCGEEQITPGYSTDIELRIPATISGPKRTENYKGKLWMTDQRIIFVTEVKSSKVKSYDSPPSLENLVIPYTHILSATFHLPTFSPNQILLAFLPDSEKGSSHALPDPGRGSHLELKMVIGEGAGHGVWKHIEGQRVRCEERRKEGEALPAYSPTDQGPSSIPDSPPPFDSKS
ncbi:hypothetical protein TREMEDRAFT_64270 [Tremella mesenterica DSM 1558]|uniref:uncharacterized protein n=1 Tax=Tremella mesenterica (strain ATCC 24925 / CBS 8224 / DSM 1558 / NBRC 9311 / NRRL Y-6157 / RJB 2259-6 / UBC 559-6) TaxID=578456 RepID=UPI0003F494D0|nr:uncharacterized protein TREMEDRAFT_64270 [Tremella mesenterica DSM 1558]EIW67675.1 hypothetical protein TREMEDRAFT_64270 [Tremella mesenterica DSM 1558]